MKRSGKLSVVSQDVGKCAIGVLCGMGDIVAEIINKLPIGCRFRTALSLSFVNRSFSVTLNVLLHENYKVWLTPLVELLECSEVDGALAIMSRSVVPMCGFLTLDYITHIKASISRNQLMRLHARLCHLVTHCDEVCPDNNNLGYRYHISKRTIDACAPKLWNPNTETSTSQQLFMDLIHILEFLACDDLPVVQAIRRLDYCQASVPLNEIYLYHKSDIVLDYDDDDCDQFFVRRVEYDMGTLIDMRRLEPLYDPITGRLSPDSVRDDIILLRLFYFDCYPSRHPVSARQLLEDLIASATMMEKFRRVMSASQ